MDSHIKRFEEFNTSGKRILPPPTMLDLDPIIPPYRKGGQEGHLYIVIPPGQENDEFVFKIGSTTQLLKRMYWYEQGTQLMYCIHVTEGLRSIEKSWIQSLMKDSGFRLVQGREYFSGSYKEAIDILGKLIRV